MKQCNTSLTAALVIVLSLFLLGLNIPVFGHTHSLDESDVYFVPNKGQWPSAVLYKAEMGAGAIFIEKESILFVFRDEKQMMDILAYKFLPAQERQARKAPSDLINYYAFRLFFQNSQPISEVVESAALNHTLNYFLDADPRSWAGNVKAFRKLSLNGIYPGIDLELEISQASLKYSFIVAPGADPAMISLKWENVQKIRKDRGGQLIIPTPLGLIYEAAPLAWTERGGKKVTQSCSFNLKHNAITFNLPSTYNKQDTLTIDPILAFASYSGSTVDNWGYTATYDEQGFLYSAGVAFGTGYPVVMGSYQVSFAGGTADIAISKYDTSGAFLVYSTYLGGSGTDVPSSLVVNNSNELVLLGCTGSSNFPVTANAFDPSFNGGTSYTLSGMLGFPNGSDIIICRFSPDGSQLLSSTFFGGTGNDGLNGYSPLKMNYGDDVRGEVVVDESDNVYVTSSTTSVNLPSTTNAFQPGFGGGDQDACVFKMNKDLGVLYWASYAGGTGRDAGYSIALGAQGSVYVAGGTTSADIPGMNAFQTTYGGGVADGYILRISNNGQLLQRATYVGYSLYDQVYFVKTDRLNNVYVLGQTSATGSAFIHNVTWSVPSGGQFISKYNPDLSARLWSTAWGTGNGGPDVSPSAFMVDVCFNLYLSAWGGPALNGFGGTAGLPVTPDAFQLTTDNNDYYFLVLDKDVTQPIFATYYGGSSSEHVDGGTSRFDRRGAIYQAVCAGCGGKDDFPTTPGAWSVLNGSTNCNNGVIKMKFNLPFLVADFVPPVSGCTPYTISFQNQSQIVSGITTQYYWDFGDGSFSTSANPVHTYTASGVYQVALIVTDPTSCNGADTLVRNLVVLSNTRDTLPDIHLCPGDISMIGLPPSPDQSITYQWFPTTGLSNPNVSNPIASIANSIMYEMLVSNGQCADTLTQVVEIHYVSVDAGPDTAVCHNVLTLQAIGNAPALYYQWSSNALFSDTLNANVLNSFVTINIVSPTTYYVRVSDGYCTAIDSIFIDFIVVAAPLSATNPNCHGDCNGSLYASASGGTPPFSYLWSNGQLGATASGLCAGNYSVTITDSMGCIAISSAQLTEPVAILSNPLIQPTPCEEVCLGNIDPGITGGTPPYAYFWSNGQTSPQISALCEGSYGLQITDANGCLYDDTFLIVIQSSFEFMTVYPKIDTLFKGQEVPISATLIPGAQYQWVPSSSLSDPSASSTLAFPSETTTYYLTVTDAYGCIYTDSIVLIVKEINCDMPNIYVPNAFSPNGDNMNDILYVRTSVARDIRFLLYDRWGEKVFETTQVDKGWDGVFRGKPCDPGVFVYYLEVKCFDGQRYEAKGNVTLLR